MSLADAPGTDEQVVLAGGAGLPALQTVQDLMEQRLPTSDEGRLEQLRFSPLGTIEVERHRGVPSRPARPAVYVAGAGSKMLNVAPSPTRLETAILPPWDSMIP